MVLQFLPDVGASFIGGDRDEQLRNHIRKGDHGFVILDVNASYLIGKLL